MTEPREALCPCGGACHHGDHPCSLGCWAAQKPWRIEEAAAGVHLGDEGLREALDRAAQHNHEEGGHQGYAGPTLYPDCADPWCREARAALAAQENPT